MVYHLAYDNQTQVFWLDTMEDKDRSCIFKLTALRCYNLSYIQYCL